MTAEEIDKRFDHQPPNGEKQAKHERVRANFKALAVLLNSFLPESREKAEAFTLLQTAQMFANAAIACNE